MNSPHLLYKYRDYHNQYNRRILFNFEIYLPSASMFNDPYEGSIPFKYKKEELTPDNLYLKMREITKFQYPHWSEQQIEEHCWKAKEKDLLNDPNHIEKMRVQNRELIDKTFGILSLTSNYLNYLMWSHYANCHTGFCIGFDTEAVYDTILGTLGPVIYQEDIPKMNLNGDVLEFYIKQLSTKSKVWNYEDEYRIVVDGLARKTISFNKEIIKHIVFGTKMQHSEKLEILDFVQKNKIDCVISELSLDLEKFILNESRVY